ncbi:hypothetical protein [Dyadobacter sp. OTU695]
MRKSIISSPASNGNIMMRLAIVTATFRARGIIFQSEVVAIPTT